MVKIGIMRVMANGVQVYEEHTISREQYDEAVEKPNSLFGGTIPLRIRNSVRTHIAWATDANGTSLPIPNDPDMTVVIKPKLANDAKW